MIAWNGYKIFKATVPVLVDASPVPLVRIAQIVESVHGVHSVHRHSLAWARQRDVH